jgi:putative SOS response-associated peptidase YedK
MCNLYTYKMSAAEMRALKLHYQFHGTTWSEWEERQAGRNEPIEDVYPNKRAPVVVVENGEHVVREDMLWGFPKYEPGANWGTNFRTLKNGQWKPWLDREHRCVVPAMAFAEPDQTTPKGAVMWRWFKRADKLPFCFAGIWRPWTGDRGTKKTPNVGDHKVFSIMTTEPNAVVKPVHRKAMPVLLMTAEDVERWLNGTTLDDALEMQKPAADDVLEVGPPVKPERKSA